MLISAHALTGAFIGKEVGYPPLAFLLGLASHFLIDAIPHSDGPDDIVDDGGDRHFTVGQYVIVLFDIVISIVVLIYFCQQKQITPGFLWGVIGAVLPDFVDNIPLWNNQIQRISFFAKFHKFHCAFQRIKTPLWAGLLIQYTIAAIFFWLIFRLK